MSLVKLPDNEALRSVNRLRGLLAVLENEVLAEGSQPSAPPPAGSRPPARRRGFEPRSVAGYTTGPSFAEMMAVVKRRGKW